MKQVILITAINLFITLGCFIAYNHWVTPHIYVFDMRGYIQSLQKEYISKGLSDREIKESIKQLARKINNIASHNQNVVILLKEVVLNPTKVKEIKIKP